MKDDRTYLLHNIFFCALAMQGAVWIPAAVTAAASLVEMQTLRPYPMTTESESAFKGIFSDLHAN